MTGPSLDLATLREKAEDATPGPWQTDYYNGEAWWYEEHVCTADKERKEVGNFYHGRDGKYVAAVSPDVILDVLALVEEQRKENERLREALTYVGEFARAHHHQQPAHVLLHGLTIDIPEVVERALAGSPAANEEQPCGDCGGTGYFKPRGRLGGKCSMCRGTGRR